MELKELKLQTLSGPGEEAARLQNEVERARTMATDSIVSPRNLDELQTEVLAV